jgi:hypothetical protein
MAEEDFEFEFDDGDDDEVFDFEEESSHRPERRTREEIRKISRVQGQTFYALDQYAKLVGDEALNDVISQCERRLQWQLECVSDRSTIDDILMRRYNIYDPDAWLRYRNSWFEKRVRNDMHHIGMMHSSMFARAVARRKLNVLGRLTLFSREILWGLMQKLDRKLQSL